MGAASSGTGALPATVTQLRVQLHQKRSRAGLSALVLFFSPKPLIPILIISTLGCSSIPQQLKPT